jgi:hypothetical protein
MNMKKGIIIIMTSHIAFISAIADKTEPFDRLRHLMAQMINNREEGYLHHSANFAIQTYAGWIKHKEYSELNNIVLENWKDILDNIEVIAPTEIHKIILFPSFISLPLQDSLQCLNKIADLTVSNAISRDTFGWVLHRYEYETGYALIHNYKNPIVIEIFQKAKTLDPPSFFYEKYPNVDDILSGKAQKEIAGFRHEAPDKSMPCKIWLVMSALSILIGISAILGAVMAWRYLRKRKQR